jgi:hypothetical protein
VLGVGRSRRGHTSFVSALSRLIWPSAGLAVQRSLRAAWTALRSRRSPATYDPNAVPAASSRICSRVFWLFRRSTSFNCFAVATQLARPGVCCRRRDTKHCSVPDSLLSSVISRRVVCRVDGGRETTCASRAVCGSFLRRWPVHCRTNSRSADEAERNEFAPELSRVVATLCPAAVEMGSMRPEHTDALWLAPERCPAGTKPAPDRLPLGPDRGSDMCERHASRFQPHRFLIARLLAPISNLTALRGSGEFDGVRRNDWPVSNRHDRLFSNLLADASNANMVALDDGLDGVTQITQQVPPIGHLNGTRRALADAVGIGAGTVARHNLHARVFAKPSRQCFGWSIRQQIHNLIALQVDQDGPIAITAAPAQSSTARIRGVAMGVALDPVEAAIRSSVSALTDTAMRVASRLPAAPPSASPR